MAGTFALACNPAFSKLNNKLAKNGGAVMAIIDDNYLLGNMDDIFVMN